MSDAAEAWLRLAALNVTAHRRNALVAAFGDPQTLFNAGAAAWLEAGFDRGLCQRLQTAAKLDVTHDLAWLEDHEVDLIPRGHPNYPLLLDQIDDPPAVLFVRGRLPDPALPIVGVVGTRRTSPYGELVAEQLSRELAAHGVGVLSGLASGIDTAAHHGALRGGGYTAAVLGCGVDVDYPAENVALAARLAEEGAVLSELPLGAGPLSWHFPMRNRIISGMSKAVLVVQAPQRSGALLTAGLAAEQNREVLVVPGLITDGRHAGCHALIRDGATLVRDVDDILAALKLPADRGTGPADEAIEPPTAALNDLEGRVAGAIGLAPVGIDDVIEKTGLPTPEVQSALVTLELKRIVQRLPGNRFVRATS